MCALQVLGCSRRLTQDVLLNRVHQRTGWTWLNPNVRGQTSLPRLHLQTPRLSLAGVRLPAGLQRHSRQWARLPWGPDPETPYPAADALQPHHTACTQDAGAQEKQRARLTRCNGGGWGQWFLSGVVRVVSGLSNQPSPREGLAGACAPLTGKLRASGIEDSV